MPDARKLILRNHLSPGDVLTMTAAVHSLHRAQPGKYRTAVDTSCPALWENNPDVEPLAVAQQEKWEEVGMHYPLVNRCGQEPVHMLQGYADFLAENLQVKAPLAVNRPLVYLSEQEKGWMSQVEEKFGYKGKFWVVNSGVKPDYTAKYYPYFQEVVDRLQGRVVFVQVGKMEHLHRPLRGVINLLGQTDDRQLIRLCWHAQGILCGVTYLMHLAAALEKPAVVVAGGREPRSWNTYARSALLSTVGMLPCCRDAGCWRSRVQKRGDGSEQDNSLCELPVFTDPPAPKCMAMILPEEVVSAILKFYEGGALLF